MNIYKITFKKLGLLGAILGLASVSNAQYLDDGIRFSQTEIGATARFKAMGGSHTALGGDLTSIGGNPAGLGFYNNSDASFTLSFQNDLNQSTYFNTTTNRNNNKVGFEQAATLIHMPVMKRHGQNMQTGWLNFNLGISYDKTQDFNTSIDFYGTNNISSYTDMLADESFYADASIPSFNNVYGQWGYDSYLVDDNYNPNPNNRYFYPTTSATQSNNQQNTEYKKGNQYQSTFAFGANYSNKFYIGASIGVAGFHYESNRSFVELGSMKDATEFNAIDPNSEFLIPGKDANAFLSEDYELKFSSIQVTDGSGVNGTIGMIFLPHRMWRVGLSATTPTWYKVRDDYTMYLDSWMVNEATDTDLFKYESPEEKYYDEYDLRTPYKLNAGITALFEEGLISADLEFVDYASMRITKPNESVTTKDEHTADVKSAYQSTFNFKIGGEYIFSPQLLVRAGLNYKGSPYKDYESTRQTASAGLGYRIHNIYIDLAYQNQLSKQEYVPYQSAVNPTQAASIENTRNNVMLTLGVKF